MHEIEGFYYDISDGHLDIFNEEEEVIATFVPGYWKAIYKEDQEIAQAEKSYVRCDHCGNYPQLEACLKNDKS